MYFLIFPNLPGPQTIVFNHRCRTTASSSLLLCLCCCFELLLEIVLVWQPREALKLTTHSPVPKASFRVGGSRLIQEGTLALWGFQGLGSLIGHLNCRGKEMSKKPWCLSAWGANARASVLPSRLLRISPPHTIFNSEGPMMQLSVQALMHLR